MIRWGPLCTRLTLLMIALAVVALTGCAAKKALTVAPDEGIVLQYRMPEGQTLKYKTAQEFIQNFEVQGRQTEAVAYTKYGFSVESKGRKDGNYELGFTVDDMEVSVTSPDGDMTGDTRDVVGRKFEMLLSPLGEEVRTSGLGGLKYVIGPNRKRGISSDFEALFPDLPDGPMKIGDTWTSTDTIYIKEDNSDIRLTVEGLNTLAGFETVEGLRCARITSAVSGSLDGTGTEGGANLIFAGKLRGNDTWHFAYEEGLYVKMQSDAAVKGTVSVGGGEGMTIPMNNTIRVELALVR